MKKPNKSELSIWIVTLLPLVITAILYPSLPEQIPMHWNVSGEIDAWGGRLSAFLIPAMLIVLTSLFVVLPKIDPKKSNYTAFSGAYYAFRLVFVCFMALLQGAVLYSAYKPGELRVGVLVPAGIGLLFAVIGNFMPKFKHNYFVGIKTPWTLSSEECWRKTHRMGGPIWFVGGIVIFLSSFFVPEEINFIVLLVTVIILAVVPMLYSLLIFKGCKKGSE